MKKASFVLLFLLVGLSACDIGHLLFGATGTGTWEFDSPYYWYQVNP